MLAEKQQQNKQTKKVNQAFAKTLNFKDVRAFENNDKGLVAEFDKKTGDIIRNSFKFIDESSADKAPSTVNPSLWRQAVLNQKAEGIYEVLLGKIYQVRGTDLASMSFINEHGIVDAALSKGISSGEVTYVTPGHELNLKSELETLTIDGLKMIFLDASETEAPSEMITYIPSMKALWTGEVTYQGMHNVYTLRGAKVCDALKWSKKINQMITLWGDEVDVMFGSHSAPIWSSQEIVAYLKLQRDAYGFTHNQTLRLANSGYVMQDLGDKIYSVLHLNSI